MSRHAPLPLVVFTVRRTLTWWEARLVTPQQTVMVLASRRSEAVRLALAPEVQRVP